MIHTLLRYPALSCSTKEVSLQKVAKLTACSPHLPPTAVSFILHVGVSLSDACAVEPPRPDGSQDTEVSKVATSIERCQAASQAEA